MDNNICQVLLELNSAAHLEEDQGMYQVTQVDRFIHLLPEGKRRPPISM